MRPGPGHARMAWQLIPAIVMAKARLMAKARQRTTEDAHASSAEATRRSPERIAARAYELYLARGGSDGQDFDDWLAAERELASGPSQGERNE